MVLLNFHDFTIVNQWQQADSSGPLDRKVAYRSLGEARWHHILYVAHRIGHVGVADKPAGAVGGSGDVACRESVDIDMSGEGGVKQHCVHLCAVDSLGRVAYRCGGSKLKLDAFRDVRGEYGGSSGNYDRRGERVGAHRLKPDDVVENLFHVVQGCAGLCGVVRVSLNMTGVVVIFF